MTRNSDSISDDCVSNETRALRARASAHINLDAIRHNLTAIAASYKKTIKVCAVIKSDGYGHGAVPIARYTADLVDYFAVATIDEGINLRRNGIDKPLLLLGYLQPERIEEALQYEMTLSVYEWEMAQAISQKAVHMDKICPIHIKIDSGMNRLGIVIEDGILDLIENITHLPNLRCEGLFTHFVSADESNKDLSNRQIALFDQLNTALNERNIKFPLRHMSASSGILDMEAGYDLVRAGISLYGLYPSNEVHKERLKLIPALSIKARVAYVKTVKKGASVSYGATFSAPCDMRVATICYGYGDGYPRRLSNKGYVLIHGKKAPIIGRVCMDYFMVDVSQIPQVQKEDEAILVGRQKESVITVEELAKLAGIINYEFICNIGKRVPRVYWKDGTIVLVKDYCIDLYNL